MNTGPIGRLAANMMQSLDEAAEERGLEDTKLETAVLVVGYSGVTDEDKAFRGIVVRSTEQAFWVNRGILDEAAELASRGGIK